MKQLLILFDEIWFYFLFGLISWLMIFKIFGMMFEMLIFLKCFGNGSKILIFSLIFGMSDLLLY